jgi:hypothetical protein
LSEEEKQSLFELLPYEDWEENEDIFRRILENKEKDTLNPLSIFLRQLKSGHFTKLKE